MKLNLGVVTWQEAGEAFLMAPGWLSQDDKVEFKEDGRIYRKEVTS